MDIDLDELERLAKAALFLPWKVTKDLEKWRGARYEIETWKGRHVGNVCNGNAKDDAAYIVAACNSLPTLIAENRALRERVRKLERERELCQELLHDSWNQTEQCIDLLHDAGVNLTKWACGVESCQGCDIPECDMGDLDMVEKYASRKAMEQAAKEANDA